MDTKTRFLTHFFHEPACIHTYCDKLTEIFYLK